MNELLTHFSGLRGTSVDGEIKIEFRSSFSARLSTLPFFYSDSFFSHSACAYDHALAKLSLGITMSAVSHKSFGARYITNSLSRAGFDPRSITTFRFEDSLSTEDSCAYAIGAKKLPDGSWLVPVVIRSHQYGGEWVSNAHVIDPAQPEYAAGFRAAAETVFSALMNYIDAHGLNSHRLKLWVTGFSRGGAVANLLGAMLNRRGFDAHKVFVYTFASPCTVRDSAWEYFGNIFNIVSEMDAVPRVPIAKWGFCRFGTDLYLPCAARRGDDDYARLLAAMIPEFREIMGQIYCAGAEYEVYEDQELVLDLLIDYIDDLLLTPEKYLSGGYQEILMEYMKCRISGDEMKLERFFRFLLSDNRELARRLCSLMEDWESLKPLERGKHISALTAAIAKKQAIKNTPATEILGMGMNILIHYAAKRTATRVTGKDKDYYYDQLTKMIVDTYRRGKKSPLLMQHWPETYLAWLCSGDSSQLFRTNTYAHNSIK
ncbi:MAG: lipase family protein [Bacillota bacterium]|nr:lipase family protein [Bacillota bacterium]